MKNLSALLLIAALAIVARAQIPNLGSCPEYLPKANFDMERFAGIWYEAERNFQLTEIATRCVRSNYTKGPDGKYRVINEIRSRVTGIRRMLEGEIRKAPSKAEEGKLHVKYTTVPFIPVETQYIVLDTDYERYAVLWSCTGAGLVHAQNAWIMTRERLAPGEVLQRAYGVLDQYKISKVFFLKTIQEDCDNLDEPAAPTEPPKINNNESDEEQEEQPTAGKSAAQEVSQIQADAPAPVAQPEKIAPIAEEKVVVKAPEAPQLAPVPVAAAEPIKAAAEAEAVKTVPEVVMKIAEQAKEPAKEPAIAEPIKEAIKEETASVPQKQESTIAEIIPKETAPVVLQEEPKKKPQITEKKAEVVEEKIEIVKP